MSARTTISGDRSDEMRTRITEMIEDELVAKGMSVAALARAIGHKPWRMKAMLSQEGSTITTPTLVRIANALDCDLQLSFVPKFGS